MQGNAGNYLVELVSSFVAEPVEAVLRMWDEELGQRTDVVFAGYGQVFQRLLGGSGADATVVLVRVEDWAREHGGIDGEAGRAAVESGANDLVEAVRVGAERGPVLVVVCPAAPETRERGFLRDVSAELVAGLREVRGVQVVTAEEIAGDYPLADYADPYSDEIAHVPYTPEYFTVLGTVVARAVHALRTARPKVVVLDADNVLWDGVVGEDGVAGVRIGAARRALHEFMLEQRSAGRLLCLSSKNEEADVLAVLAGRDDAPLAPGHFSALRVGWQSKAQSIRELAEELGLGLDSFVFLDDSPVECAAVRAACPEVLTLQLPADADAALEFVRHCWALDVPPGTEDDARRAARYEQERERRELRGSATTLAEFIESLDLVVAAGPAEPGQLERVAQLTQRTNQFNLTAVRRTAAQIRDSGLDCHVVRVRDRFGDYGLVGAVLFGIVDGRLEIDSFLLSCRVLGRGVEHRVLSSLGWHATREGASRIVLPVVPTPRNRPARDFAESVAGPAVSTAGGRSLHVMDATVARSLEFRPDTPAAAPAAEISAPLTRADWQGVTRVAAELADPAALHAAVARHRGVPHHGPTPDAETPMEHTVAGLWAEVLGIAPGSVHDSFFALGGQSLQVVQFMARVRTELGVELPIELLFSPDFTVAHAAKEIDGARPFAADLDVLMREVEALTDDELEAMLAAEGL